MVLSATSFSFRSYFKSNVGKNCCKKFSLYISERPPGILPCICFYDKSIFQELETHLDQLSFLPVHTITIVLRSTVFSLRILKPRVQTETARVLTGMWDYGAHEEINILLQVHYDFNFAMFSSSAAKERSQIVCKVFKPLIYVYIFSM